MRIISLIIHFNMTRLLFRRSNDNSIIHNEEGEESSVRKWNGRSAKVLIKYELLVLKMLLRFQLKCSDCDRVGDINQINDMVTIKKEIDDLRGEAHVLIREMNE